jgi:hypothetical protein
VLAGWRAHAAERTQRKTGADRQFVRYMTRNVLADREISSRRVEARPSDGSPART